MFEREPPYDAYDVQREARETVRTVEDHFGWLPPVEPFLEDLENSHIKVFEAEATTIAQRQEAQRFVLHLAFQIQGRYPIIDELTGSAVNEAFDSYRFKRMLDDPNVPEFSLENAYATVLRKLWALGQVKAYREDRRGFEYALTMCRRIAQGLEQAARIG